MVALKVKDGLNKFTLHLMWLERKLFTVARNCHDINKKEHC